MDGFKALKISPKVYWVGAVDWGVRDFHGYSTSRGTTYNAYLILADKVTLVDTVKPAFFGEMMARIKSVVDPSKVEIIVSNHSELDHSGSLPAAISALKPEKVYASKMGQLALKNHFHWNAPVEAVADGGSLDLGNDKLVFYESRMLHWPDSMVSLLAGDNVLFSNDIFGMHLASYERFADELSPEVLEQEAAKYYANIITPYSHLVLQFLSKVKALGLNPAVIACDHGPVWRKDIGRLADWYGKWAKRDPQGKVVVLYDTMWGSTERLANSLAEGAHSAGARVKVLPLHSSHRSDAATELLDAGALAVGSPTLNQNIFPTVADAMTYIKGLKFKNLIGASFGSYGWSGDSVKQLSALLKEMQVPETAALACQYVPSEDVAAQAFSIGVGLAQKLKG